MSNLTTWSCSLNMYIRKDFSWKCCLKRMRFNQRSVIHPYYNDTTDQSEPAIPENQGLLSLIMTGLWKRSLSEQTWGVLNKNKHGQQICSQKLKQVFHITNTSMTLVILQVNHPSEVPMRTRFILTHCSFTFTSVHILPILRFFPHFRQIWAEFIRWLVKWMLTL